MTSIFMHKVVDRLINMEFAERVGGDRDPINEDQVIAVLVFMRNHLEEKECGRQYPTISFYADWIVHVSLDRRPAQGVLARIADAIQGCEHSQDYDWFDPETSNRI